MMATRCGRVTKKILRKVGRELKPLGLRLIGEIVGHIATTGLSSSEKREAAMAASKASLKAAGIEAQTHMIGLALEFAVTAGKQGEGAVIGDATDPDMEDDD